MLNLVKSGDTIFQSQDSEETLVVLRILKVLAVVSVVPDSITRKDDSVKMGKTSFRQAKPSHAECRYTFFTFVELDGLSRLLNFFTSTR